MNHQQLVHLGSLTRKRVLVMDDNPANVELLEALLEDHDFENVEGICDPRQVLSRCQRQRPDVLLLDIRMPHLDGFQVLEQLESRLDGGAPPVIVLTAQIDDGTRRRALGMGVRDFLVKPLKHDEVIQRLHNVLAIQHRFQVRDREADDLEQMVVERTRALARLSLTDPVTGLPNRRALLQRLDEMLPAQTSVGVLFIALDQLEDCVRLHGYAITETLLKELGETLQACLQAPCYLGFWGGSELLVIVPDAPGCESLETLADDLIARIDIDHRIGNRLISLKARIGIHLARAGDPERLVQMASLALPQDKEPSRQCYNLALEAAQQRQLSLRQALRGIVERREVSLFYQPKVSLSDDRVLGAEALLRWCHPRLGYIAPEEFIPLAEASGDILAIGDWVIEEAIVQAIDWRNREWFDDDFDIAINVSPRQLAREGFAERLLARMRHHHLAYHHLTVEITESAMISDLHKALCELTQLSRAGVRIAIDDFGTGHSSMAYLKSFPVSILKIDRSFVSESVVNAQDQRLLGTMIGLADGFGCEVVAEGIETVEQAGLLKRMGCEIGQGYVYSPPLPSGAFVRFCQTR